MRRESAAVRRMPDALETGDACRPGWCVSTALEQSLRSGGEVDDSGPRHNVEFAHFCGTEFGQPLHEIEEALDLTLLEHGLGENAELIDVVLAHKGPRAERVRVCDSDLVDDLRAVRQFDLDAAAECFLGRIL